jgi:hypothetical protein
MVGAAVDTPVLAPPRASPAGTPFKVSLYLIIISKSPFKLYEG